MKAKFQEILYLMLVHYGPLQSGAATFSKGLVKCFLRVPQAVTAVAMLPKQARGTFRKLITKPSLQVAAPDCSFLLLLTQRGWPNYLWWSTVFEALGSWPRDHSGKSQVCSQRCTFSAACLWLCASAGDAKQAKRHEPLIHWTWTRLLSRYGTLPFCYLRSCGSLHIHFTLISTLYFLHAVCRYLLLSHIVFCGEFRFIMSHYGLIAS